ncbi:MAG: Rrf2 family transcriptional regulator [bacterium]|jgi:Rrf2 family protein
MKLLTKDTDYAVRAIVHLARNPDGYQSSREIAKAEGIPLQFLRAILQRLTKEGLIVSREGVRGGVKLKARPRDVRVSDIIRIFQGDIELSECMFRKKLCSNRSTCVLRARIKSIEEMVNREFEKVTIAKLIDDLGGK